MVSTSDYLKNWFDTTKHIITQPRDFFKAMPTSGSLREPLEYMLFTTFIASLLTIPMVLVVMTDSLTEISLMSIILTSIGVLVFSFIIIGMSLPMNALMYHFLLKISGAKGNLETTARVYCYYLAAGMIVLPAFGIMILLSYIEDMIGLEGMVSDIISVIFLLFITIVTIYFSFYVLMAGFSEAHGISMKRVFLGVFGIPIALAMILIAIPMLFVFSSGFSTEVSDQSGGNTFDYDDEYVSTRFAEYETTDGEPTDETITAPYGSAPIVDGYYTPEDQWYETQKVPFIAGDAIYTMAAKHDNENLYILLRWKGEPEWKNSIALYFEQDGYSHDHVLETGREDCKSNGADTYGPSNLVDSHDNGDVREKQDGIVAGNYSDDFWTQEWMIPLRSDEQGDINVEQLPATLGLVVTDVGTRMVWPAGALPSRPETWGDLEIVNKG